MTIKKWQRLGLLLIAVLTYAAGWYFCQAAKENASLTYLLLSRNIDATEAEEIFAQEKALPDSIGFCFWGETAAKTVICKETGGIAQVTQVLLSGNPGILNAGSLAWQDGCFVDETTARSLFGTADCGGQILWREDIAYPVLGTIFAFQPTMLTVAAETDGVVLNRCALFAPAESGTQAADQFMLRWGLQGEMIDFFSLWSAVHNYLLLLPCLFVLVAFLYSIRKVRRILHSEDFSFSAMVKPAGFLLIYVCLLCFLGSQIQILPDLIPSRWSDFSFWGKALEAQKENLRQVLLTPMGSTHLQMMLDMVKSMVSSTAAALLTLWAFRR